jgi:hypothetical protein
MMLGCDYDCGPTVETASKDWRSVCGSLATGRLLLLLRLLKWVPRSRRHQCALECEGNTTRRTQMVGWKEKGALVLPGLWYHAPPPLRSTH